MKVVYREISIVNKSRVCNIVEHPDFSLGREVVMSVDCSSSNTGISIIDLETKEPLYSISIKPGDSSFVIYKRELYKIYLELVHGFNIKNFIYEEPFIGHIQAVEKLMMLKALPMDLEMEMMDEGKEFKVEFINNQAWKKRFLAPLKVPKGTKAQKEATRVRARRVFGELLEKKLTEDEIDSIAIGFIWAILRGKESEKELVSREFIRKFDYEAHFLCGDSVEEALEWGMDVIPKVVMDNGIVFSKATCNSFDKEVKELIGNEDRAGIIQFNKGKYANKILEYEVYDILEQDGEFMYAIVYRSKRKKAKNKRGD